MKTLINKAGKLSIEKLGKMLQQMCPYAHTDSGSAKCGTQCPKFGIKKIMNVSGIEGYHISICNNEKIFINDEDITFDKIGESETNGTSPKRV